MWFNVIAQLVVSLTSFSMDSIVGFEQSLQ